MIRKIRYAIALPILFACFGWMFIACCIAAGFAAAKEWLDLFTGFLDEQGKKLEVVKVESRMEYELAAVDMALGNRMALDGFKTRYEKINHACNEAGRVAKLEGDKERLVAALRRLRQAALLDEPVQSLEINMAANAIVAAGEQP